MSRHGHNDQRRYNWHKSHPYLFDVSVSLTHFLTIVSWRSVFEAPSYTFVSVLFLEWQIFTSLPWNLCFFLSIWHYICPTSPLDMFSEMCALFHYRSYNPPTKERSTYRIRPDCFPPLTTVLNLLGKTQEVTANSLRKVNICIYEGELRVL